MRPHLGQFLHQVCLGLQPAGPWSSKPPVRCPWPGAAPNRIEQHGGGIGVGAGLAITGNAAALSPDRDLLHRGRAESVGGGEIRQL